MSNLLALHSIWLTNVARAATLYKLLLCVPYLTLQFFYVNVFYVSEIHFSALITNYL